MNRRAKVAEVSQAEGKSWLKHQLEQGFDLSAAVLAATSFEGGRFETFVPADVPSDQIHFPEGPDVPETEFALAGWLENVREQGAQCVLIEDDVKRRGDPRQPNPSAYLGDRVIHWCSLDEGEGLKVAEAIDQGAFGYPLNAFVVPQSADDLGLSHGERVPAELPEQVAAAFRAVIVSAFDATSYAMWTVDVR